MSSRAWSRLGRPASRDGWRGLVASRDEPAGKPRDVPLGDRSAGPLPRAPGRSLVSTIPHAAPGLELSLEQIALSRGHVFINPDRLPEQQRRRTHHEAPS